MFKLNIVTQLLSFFILAIIVNHLNLNTLSAISTIFIAITTLTKTDQFLRAIKRFKWFFLVMISILALNTPGEHISAWPFSISPTYEGVNLGLTQMLRVVVMLAALSLILAANSRQQLISGFYFIFSPLQYLGLEIDRFAVRLWLTLHYVEQERGSSISHDFFSRLKDMTNLKPKQNSEEVTITFKLPQFSFIDYAIIVLLVMFALKSVW
jgi:energy-coupling factor transporter transmembrane protein EcfT